MDPLGRRRSPVAELLDRPLTTYYLILGSGAMLLVLGLVMVLSASSIESYRASQSVFSTFQRQLAWCAAGLPLMWLASRLPVRAFRLLAYPALAGTVLLLALVQVPGFGVEVNGNRNWLSFGGPFRLQPSEPAKLALIVWSADLLTRKLRLLDRWRHLLVPLLPVACAVLGLVLLGRDLGTALVLMAITAALLFFAGAPLRLFGVLGVTTVALLGPLVWGSANRRARLLSFLTPSSDPLDTGYQLWRSKFALGSGGWFGLGLGASREKWGWLPEQDTDFIFAIIGEELGLVGTLAVLLLFAGLVFGAIRVSMTTRDLFVRLASAGIAGWIAVQVLVNVGAVLGLLPITGIPLPLISYGGSALLPTMLALGMLLSFARHDPAAARALAARGPGVLRRTALLWLPERVSARLHLRPVSAPPQPGRAGRVAPHRNRGAGASRATGRVR